ncbi:MAG: spondin domain-containing protein [Phycisphaeraceae bacterium]|nr:spondin domain-containing protein [Phycisphaeraceae bacterium]
MKRFEHALVLFGIGTCLACGAQAGVVQVRVKVESLVGANGVAFSPFTVAFHDGSWDAFNNGAAASTGIQNIAETGDGSAYLAAFGAAYAPGVSGVVAATLGGFGPGIYLPGASGTFDFAVDTAANRYFSFGSMVVPSNDRFFGNDSATAVALFDGLGNFLNPIINLKGSDIWDAGTELDAPFGSAFIAGQSAGDHNAQGGVVGFHSDFSAYLNALTAAGYNFTNLPSAGDALARITFEIVPAPGVAGVFGFAGLAFLRRRRG